MLNLKEKQNILECKTKRNHHEKNEYNQVGLRIGQNCHVVQIGLKR